MAQPDAPAGSMGARRLLRAHPELGVLVGSYVLSQATRGLLILVLPLYLLDKGFTFLTVGGLFALLPLVGAGGQLLAGRYPEHLARPGPILVLMSVGVGLMPALLLVDTAAGFFAVALVQAAVGAAAAPGVMLLVSEAAPDDRQAAVFGLVGSVSSFAYGGAVAAGGLLAALGWSVTFGVAAGLSAASVFLMGRFLYARRRTRGPLPAELDACMRQLRAVRARARTEARRLSTRRSVSTRSRDNARLSGLHFFLFGMALTIYPVFFPRHLLSLGLPLGTVGLVVAGSWVVFGAVQPFAGLVADRTGRHRVLVVSGLLAAALLNVVLARGSLPAVIAAWMLIGVVDGLTRPVATGLFVYSVEPAARAMAFGATQAAQTVSRSAGPLGIATVIFTAGLSTGFLVMAVLVALSAVPLLFLRPVASAAPAPVSSPVPDGETA